MLCLACDWRDRLEKRALQHLLLLVLLLKDL